VRFKIDENLPQEVSLFLNSCGHDAHSVHSEGLTGSDDMGLIETCKKEDRLLITLDLDFADIRMYPYAETPGIIVIRTENQSKNNVLSIVSRISALPELISASHKLWIVEESRIRVRE